MSIVAPVLLAIACIGYGRVATWAFDAGIKHRPGVERLSLDLAVGIGVLGWLLFFAGIVEWFTPAAIWSVTAAGVAVFVLMSKIGPRQQVRSAITADTTKQAMAALTLLVVVLFMDLLEGMSPPADGDTLAYHAAIPKYFAQIGRIEFLPTAVTGAIPLLTHLLYTAAYTMGGELAMTLWLMISGWAPGLLIYAFARRYIDHRASLILAVLFLTTPAILFSGGSGHVEVRAAVFVLAACIYFVDGGRSGSWRHFALAGMLAGCFVGTKYFGVLFAASLGLVILLSQRRISPLVIFSVFAIVFGGQWYLWNFIHTGDPMFPSLFTLLGVPDNAYWTADFSKSFADYYSASEKVLETTPLNWLLYPVYATFYGLPELESTRTGFGVLIFLLLPLTLWGMARFRVWEDDRFLLLAVAGIFFTVWFFSGTTHRARHLVPVFPLLLVGGFLFAHEAALHLKLYRPFWITVAIAMTLQLAGQVVFSANYAKYVFTGETRDAFYERNVTGANAVAWINRHLEKGSKVAYFNRELGYLLDPPSFFMTAYYQTQVEWRPEKVRPEQFTTQVRKEGITHFILKPPEMKNGGKGPQLGNFKAFQHLEKIGCIERLKTFDTVVIPSRTFAAFGRRGATEQMALFRLQAGNCPQ